MNMDGEYYDFTCHALLTPAEADQHRNNGCDVDTVSQSEYKRREMENRPEWMKGSSN